jgi:putative membrane protein
VAWFAGLFYIFRLFVYHRQNSGKGEVAALFSLMEGRLLKAIILPASLSTLGFGLALLHVNSALLREPWIWIKLFLVLLLFGYQGLSHWVHRRFRAGDFVLTEKHCRIINEFPTLILIAVVFLAVLKPRFGG